MYLQFKIKIQALFCLLPGIFNLIDFLKTQKKSCLFLKNNQQMHANCILINLSVKYSVNGNWLRPEIDRCI